MKIGELRFKEEYPDDYEKAIQSFSDFKWNTKDEICIIDYIWDKILNDNSITDKKHYNYSIPGKKDVYLITAERHPEKKRRLLVQIYLESVDELKMGNSANEIINETEFGIDRVFTFLGQFDIDKIHSMNLEIIKEGLKDLSVIDQKGKLNLFYFILTFLCHCSSKINGSDKLIYNVKAMGANEELVNELMQFLKKMNI